MCLSLKELQYKTRAAAASNSEYEIIDELQRPSAAVTSRKFSIGICAADESPSVPELLELIRKDPTPPGFVLSRIILVASACSSSILNYASEISQLDNRLLILQESERQGKAEALNKIFESSDGELLVLINADAMPERGAISKLLSGISAADTVGIVSAKPYFNSMKGLLANIEQFMWLVHNECSFILNHMHISNHSNDEMMVIRTKLLRRLPKGLVNDGAFISACVKDSEFSIKFCDDAGVRIQVPSKIPDCIGQRRRIIFGHFQVWKLLGGPPKTVESILFLAPLLGLRILVRSLAKSPKFLTILPIAIITEIFAISMALVDVARSTDKHGIWKRYGS